MPYFIAVSRDLSIRAFEFINLLYSVYSFFRVPDTQGSKVPRFQAFSFEYLTPKALGMNRVAK